MAVEGDDLWNCVIPCSNNNGDILCNTACIEQDEGAGFCVPKLPGISDMKVCCCNNGRWVKKDILYNVLFKILNKFKIFYITFCVNSEINSYYIRIYLIIFQQILNKYKIFVLPR